MQYVDLQDLRVKRAVKFVEDEITIALKRFPSAFLKTQLEQIPWIYYSPALTAEEKEERDLLIDKYGSSKPDQIDYYLLYHNCDAFVVFYWTVLHASGITTKIVCQDRPFRHSYLQKESGEVVDALLSHCGVSYPHQPETAQKFETPYDFYSRVFISAEDRREWEIELLNDLKRFE